MSCHTRAGGPRLCWAAWLAISACCGASSALAQDQSTTAAPDAPQTAPESLATAPAEQDATVPAALDQLSADSIQLRAEVEEIKANQAAAELAHLEAELESTQDGLTEQDPLRISGFMDFGFDKWFVDSIGIGLFRPTVATSFVFGNLNLYVDATPAENVRALVEVRLTLAPHGEETQFGPPIGAEFERINTEAFDYASPSSQSKLRLGGVFIERAWSEYAFSQLVKLQAGLFLNPFGIWNLDHGSPTLISLMLPTFIAGEMLPTRLLGVRLYGAAFASSTEFGYSLHASNGRSPVDFDLTEDKALGVRLYVAHQNRSVRIVLGTSGYFGTYVDATKTINPVAAATTGFGKGLWNMVRTVDYTEQVLGFDLALDVNAALRVRSEVVMHWIGYKDDKSERSFAPDGSEQYLPSRFEWCAYLLAAYRTPWRVEAYANLELSSKALAMPKWAEPAQWGRPDISVIAVSAGLNFELTTATLLKGQIVYYQGYGKGFVRPTNDFPVVFTRLVTSF